MQVMATVRHKTPKGTIHMRIPLYTYLLKCSLIHEKSVFVTFQHECWRKSGVSMENQYISSFLQFFSDEEKWWIKDYFNI